jgi:hypothetical protein
MVAPRETTISVLPDFSDGVEETQTFSQDFSVQAQGGAWGVDAWETFVWDGPLVGVAEVRIDGSGTNIAVVLVSESIYNPPHTLQGLVVHYDVRGIKR